MFLDNSRKQDHGKEQEDRQKMGEEVADRKDLFKVTFSNLMSLMTEQQNAPTMCLFSPSLTKKYQNKKGCICLPSSA